MAVRSRNKPLMLLLLVLGIATPLVPALRLNCGGGALPGIVADSAQYHAAGSPILSFDRSAGRTPSVYNSHSWKPNRQPLVYEFTVPNGVPHTVKLYFSEIYSGAAVAGGRIISALVNDGVVVSNADIFTLSGSQLFKPVTYVSASVLAVSGKITVRVISKVQNAMISGIDIEQVTTVPALTPTPSPTLSVEPALATGSLLRVNCGGSSLPGPVVADLPLYHSASDGPVFAYSTGQGRRPSVYNSHAYTQTSRMLRYQFSVPNVASDVTLRFAETFSGAARAGGRLLSIAINGETIATNVDVYTRGGSQLFAPVDFTRKSVLPQNGKITIEINGLVQNAMISGIDIAVGPALVGSGTWRLAQTTGAIVVRHEACAVMVAGKVYMIGGRGSRATNVYDPVAKTWETRGLPPVELNHMQCVAYKNRYVYVAGAWFGPFPNEKTHAVTYVYDTVADVWTTEPGLGARARGGGAFTFYNGKFYLAFGNRGGHGASAATLAEFDSYDPVTKTWTALANAPNARDHVGGAIIGTRFCAGGGRNGGTGNFWESPITPINCYNFATNLWEVHPNLPEGRAGAATGATCQGLLMIAGGEGRIPGTTGQAFSRVDLYDPESRTFKVASNLLDSRHGSGLAVADCSCGNIYLPSGSGNLGGSPELTTMEVWSPDGVIRDC